MKRKILLNELVYGYFCYLCISLKLKVILVIWRMCCIGDFGISYSMKFGVDN